MIRWCAVFWVFAAAVLSAGEPAFYRAVNLGGPALTIDGRPWEAGEVRETTIVIIGRRLDHDAISTAFHLACR